MKIEGLKAYIIMLYVIMAAIILLSIPLKAQVIRADGKPHGPVDLLTWPASSQDAAREMRGKYGKPDIESHDFIIWLDHKHWTMITVSKAESQHSFPLDHTDVLEQTIRYRVPIDKYQALAEFDGSITINRTQGTLSARCHSEAFNILTLNLAHDIIIGMRSVEEARLAYAEFAREKMAGGNPEYMRKLHFEAQKDTNDADVNTTGLVQDGTTVITKASTKSGY